MTPLATDQVQVYLDYEARQRREGLFEAVTRHLGATRALYPGSWIHIAPSLFIPEVIYVDNDRRCPAFFADPAVEAWLQEHRQYAAPPVFRFHHQDYVRAIPEPVDHVDLLVSQFAGIVSQPCTRYLRPGGHLLANDSHGDAGVAFLDPCYELVGTLTHDVGVYTFSDDALDTYFVPKGRDHEKTIEGRIAAGRGQRYVRTADHYLFRRVG